MSKLTNKLRWAWFDFGVREERKRIIELLKKEFGEDYYDMGVVGQIVALINESDDLIDLEALEIPQFEGTRDELNALTIKGGN